MSLFILTVLPLLQEAQDGAAVPEAPTPSLLEPNFGLVFWTTVVFLVVLGILWKYAWGPITEALDHREEHIDESLQRAEVALAEAKKVQSENTKARREAEQEAQRILHEARDQAEELREEERQKTRDQIQHMQEQAQKEIEREKESALDDLRDEVAVLAIQAAEKILRENLDDSRQRRLIDDFINDLPRN